MRIEIKNIQNNLLSWSESSVSAAINTIVRYGAHNIKSYHIHIFKEESDDADSIRAFHLGCCDFISQLIEENAKLMPIEDSMMIRVSDHHSSISGLDISMKGAPETLKALPFVLLNLLSQRKEPLDAIEIELRLSSDALSENALQELSKQNCLEVDLKVLLNLLSKYSATEEDYKQLIEQNLKCYYENSRFLLIDELIDAYLKNTLQDFPFRSVSHASVMEVFHQKEKNPAALNLLSLFLNQVFLEGRTEAIFLGINETIQKQMDYIDRID